MDMKTVGGSSNVAAVGYDPETKTMTVQFKNGGTYEYSGVSQVDHDRVFYAPSVGGAFATHIKGKYAYRKV